MGGSYCNNKKGCKTIMTYLVLVRHGETTGKSSERLYGSTDIPLSEFGCKQMTLAGKALERESFDRVITSPLIRSIKGANLVLNGHNSSIIIEEFREIDFGSWEGYTLLEVQKEAPELYEEWMKGDIGFTFPEGDKRKSFFDRIAQASIREFNMNNGKTLAVLHKGVIKGVIATLLKKEISDMAHYPIELGSIHRLHKNSKGWEIVASNEIDHLEQYRVLSSK